MKSTTVLVAAIAVLSAAFSVGARAESGRPSTLEAPAAPIAVVDDAAAGSYARYLMLNGVDRDRALQMAASTDHPAVPVTPLRVARARAAAKAPAATRQQ